MRTIGSLQRDGGLKPLSYNIHWCGEGDARGVHYGGGQQIEA